MSKDDQWISIKDKFPELNKSILAFGKSGFYHESFKTDDRTLQMYVGFFYDKNGYFKKLKKDICFEVDCGCSGAEFDREYIEITHWMPLPKPPK